MADEAKVDADKSVDVISILRCPLATGDAFAPIEHALFITGKRSHETEMINIIILNTNRKPIRPSYLTNV